MLPELKEHQQQAIEWITGEKRGLLGDPPGLGKTRVAIEAFDGGKVLVVAPSMVINGGTWSDELAKWAEHPERFTVAPYSMLNARQGSSPNFGTKKNPKYQLREEYQQDWDAVIVDECHYTKGRSTSWTWAVQQIAKRSEHLLEMTGTPVPNWAYELYTLLCAVYPDRAKRGGPLGSYWRWVAQWFQLSPSPFDSTAKIIGGLLACNKNCEEFKPDDPCEHYREFMDVNLGSKFLRRRREDCLDLPPVTFQEVQVPMTADQARIYREIKKDFLSEVDGTEIIAWTQGAKNVMLDKITTSPWLLNQQGPPKGGKLEMLRFDLQGRSRPTVVFAHYRDSVEACVEVARSCGLTAEGVHGGLTGAVKGERVRAFKEGKLDVIVGSLETMAEGLQLTIADMLIFVEVSFKPSRNEQARMRIDRMGQERSVVIHDYVTPGSVDQKKRGLLASKTDQQMRLMSARDFAKIV